MFFIGFVCRYLYKKGHHEMKEKLESAAIVILSVLILGPMIGAAFSVSPYMGFAMLGVLILAMFRRNKKD
jgi:uncharacterized membrane protein YqhA